MTVDEQRHLLEAVRASLRSALGGLEHYMRRLSLDASEGTLEDRDDALDEEDEDDSEEPSELAAVSQALSEAVRALRPPPALPPFPTRMQALRDLIAQYAPDGGTDHERPQA